MELTGTQKKVIAYYRTGAYPEGLQSNHRMAAERALRGKGILQPSSADPWSLELTEVGKSIEI